MKDYSEDMVMKLNKESVIIDLDGLEVEVKEIPEDTISNRLDPRALNDAKNMIELRNKERGENKPTLEEIREEMGGFNRNLNTVQIYTKYIEIETTYGKVPVWMYFPKSSRKEKKRKAFLYLHGGAFFGGTVFNVENECRLIAERADCVTFNIDYSLAPENPFPIPCTQGYEVLRYVYEHAHELGIDPNKIAMGGDSAGGNLTAVCAQIDRDKGTKYLRLQTLLYPKLTFTNHKLPGYERRLDAFTIAEEEKEYLPMLTHIGSDESNDGDERVYVGGREDITNPYISPAFGDKEGLCRTVLLLAEYDGLRLEGEFYAKRLREAKVEVRVIRYNGMMHGFFDRLGYLPQAEAAVNEIVAEIKKM